MSKQKRTIVTHSSKFHNDDIFAVATLFLALGNEYEFSVVRSRDPEVIAQADIVVDVGGVYDPAHFRFDHHQEGGAGGRDNNIPYASFGLVWKTYGGQLCGSDEIATEIDTVLVQPIDAHDNGVEFRSTLVPGLYPYDLRTILGVFRPTWKEDTNLDTLFLELVSYAQALLVRHIAMLRDEYEARDAVIAAYERAEDKRVIMLDERYPWERTLAQFPEPLFVIYPKRVDNTWSLKVIRDDPNSFIARKDLPEAWAGKFDAELEAVTGVPGSIFCHNNRFLAVAQTREAIVALAQRALAA